MRRSGGSDGGINHEQLEIGGHGRRRPGGLSTEHRIRDSYWEVEAARANARAGGPTNARDAELLERYGCLSGTYASRLCQRLSHGDSGNYQRRYYKRRPR